jgi:hypothetical protein
MCKFILHTICFFRFCSSSVSALVSSPVSGCSHRRPDRHSGPPITPCSGQLGAFSWGSSLNLTIHPQVKGELTYASTPPYTLQSLLHVRYFPRVEIIFCVMIYKFAFIFADQWFPNFCSRIPIGFEKYPQILMSLLT